MSKCKECGADIRWIKTPTGTAMPCDPKLVHAKINHIGSYRDRIVVESDKHGGGVVYACDLVSDDEEYSIAGYVPHWATCPAADRFKKGR